MRFTLNEFELGQAIFEYVILRLVPEAKDGKLREGMVKIDYDKGKKEYFAEVFDIRVKEEEEEKDG